MIAGIAIGGIGGHQFYKHVVDTIFMGKIESADEKTTNTIETIGRIGYAGRSVLMIGTGFFFFFFFVAGVQYNSDEVKGLSGLLGELGKPVGTGGTVGHRHRHTDAMLSRTIGTHRRR